MADRHDALLEEHLRDVATRLGLPDPPDIADRVLAGIERGEARRIQPFWARPVFAAAMFVVLLAGATLLFSPTARDAVAGWIGLDGLEIGYGEQPERPLGDDLRLGQKLSLSEATARAGFEVRPPAEVGAPDEVYLGANPDPRLTLVYEARSDLPRAPTTQVGLLLSVFHAQLDHTVVSKKALGTGTTVQEIQVNGAPGYWVSGEPHAVFYLDEGGALREDRGRLAGNTLVWQDEDLIYRLESRLSKERALQIARSIP